MTTKCSMKIPNSNTLLVISNSFDLGDDVLIDQLWVLRRCQGDLCIHGHSVQVPGGEDVDENGFGLIDCD